MDIHKQFLQSNDHTNEAKRKFRVVQVEWEKRRLEFDGLDMKKNVLWLVGGTFNDVSKNNKTI